MQGYNIVEKYSISERRGVTIEESSFRSLHSQKVNILALAYSAHIVGHESIQYKHSFVQCAYMPSTAPTIQSEFTWFQKM